MVSERSIPSRSSRDGRAAFYGGAVCRLSVKTLSSISSRLNSCSFLCLPYFSLFRPACRASLLRPPLSGFLPPPAVRAASPSSALPILHPPTCLPGLIRSAGRIAPPSPSSASIFK